MIVHFLVPVIAVLWCFSIIPQFIHPFTADGSVDNPANHFRLLLSGWQGAVVQLAILGMATMVYFPFVKMLDKVALEQETPIEKVS
jgi:PTS system cellobiose-specific IIC component